MQKPGVLIARLDFAAESDTQKGARERIRFDDFDLREGFEPFNGQGMCRARSEEIDGLTFWMAAGLICQLVGYPLAKMSPAWAIF